MIEFNYEYEVIDTHNLGVYGLKERLKPYGNAGWVVNCSIGGLLILSRIKMTREEEINRLVNEMNLGWDRMERINREHRKLMAKLNYFPGIDGGFKNIK